MKRLLSLVIAVACTLTLISCAQTPAGSESTPTDGTLSPADFAVPAPMAYPDYTFSGTPTPDELRQTAIRAMRDLLSIQWCTEIEIAYYKSGPVSNKRFEHLPMNIYGGTIYSNASTGLFQFMEFYDPETGMLSYPGPVYKMKEAIGNSCADSLLWGYSAVCNSITGGFYPATMVYSNGYKPVGGYSYDYSIRTFTEFPSNKIIDTNGEEKILFCYTQVKPADSLVSTTANHAMMAIDVPNVVYNDDGTLNTAESYIPIQDQRGGSGEGFYDAVENGNTVHYSGRTSYNFTFAELLEKHYIPVTVDEFTGDKAYEKATLTTSVTDITTLDDLANATVTSNYPLALIRVTLVNTELNKETVLDRVLFGGDDEAGVPRTYNLGDLSSLGIYKEPGHGQEGNHIRIDVTVSTGEQFTIADITL